MKETSRNFLLSSFSVTYSGFSSDIARSGQSPSPHVSRRRLIKCSQALKNTYPNSHLIEGTK
jgi:hypothetical protein